MVMKWVKAKAGELRVGDVVRSKKGAIYTLLDQYVLCLRDAIGGMHFRETSVEELDKGEFERPMTVKDIDAKELAKRVGESWDGPRNTAEDYIDAIKEMLDE